MSEDALIKQGRILKGPFEIALDITNECNYRCIHCYNASGENVTSDDEMTDGQIIELIHDIVKLQPYNVCFCGGEPFLRLDLILKSLEILRRGNIRSTSLVTNGYFTTYERLEKLYEHGLRRIQVSLDGATPESCNLLRRNDRAFDRAIDALKNAKEVGFKNNSIAFCPTKVNISELESVVKMCIELSVSLVRVQPLMVIGRATRNIEEILPSREQYVELIGNIHRLNSKYQDSGIMVEWGDPLDHMFRYKEDMRNLSVFVNIRANGSIAPSPYLPITVGNVKRHKLSDYWNGGLYRAWSMPQVRRMASNVLCINDMGSKKTDTPDVWYEKDIELDIIDDKIFFEGEHT
ncbi:MAG: radical SAM protein [Methanomassiliicoccaceae archaeon]|nr:radical SAM protein [Methanomassiliicoccaceae archaeon]